MVGDGIVRRWAIEGWCRAFVNARRAQGEAAGDEQRGVIGDKAPVRSMCGFAFEARLRKGDGGEREGVRKMRQLSPWFAFWAEASGDMEAGCGCMACSGRPGVPSELAIRGTEDKAASMR